MTGSKAILSLLLVLISIGTVASIIIDPEGTKPDNWICMYVSWEGDASCLHIFNAFCKGGTDEHEKA